MAWYCSGSTNAELVDNLFKAGLVKNERVKNAMLGVDRAHYAPSRPYSDSPQPIGYGATISAPHMHGHACEYLIDFLRPGSRVLDIGSGSGYLTHVLANLVTDPSVPDDLNGHVIGIDHIPELVDLADKNMHKSDQGRKLLDTGKVKFIIADGRLGWQEGAPYDAIHVGAAAEKLHPALIAQLRAPGRMFIPVDTECDGSARGFGGGQYIWVVDKRVDGSVHKEKVFQVSYVPLTDPPKK
ncbi:protein-L-isoaspartate O-methyltransferase [Aspergillus pseudonomiae]|uniref:Protein-L-isoaspartate O-methyltransferase n=1 Tax=Aspergillus pseudonomiae TaxID=1506151 RepID=A0A5N7D0E8_9EURO|nr:protein-L-isoaspartate O-methyltransferase [Aspergillus pseudonomiae]KAB8254005.1 protein-L-isoaspartate O-methyltransferase [Aspergillus pseudonomiae]KAE8399328.1 protein-L-isoaspartate O-methyltransferase [Aspergillus pseudonomiae]